MQFISSSFVVYYFLNKNRRFIKLSILAGTLLFLLLPLNKLFPQPIPQQSYAGMKWRLVGPYRAGWATMAEGIPDKPNTFYFGAAGGGVWKSNDAGRTWHALMQHEGAASVGALDIAPSNSKIIYVGTGQVALRYDIIAGDGVYKTEDDGKTWKNVGLKDTRHIGRILVDSKDPQKVLVAAMGHTFNANKERGVFLTNDGGKTWKKVLYVDENTGAVDLASDPEHPSVVYAALWQMRMHPWLDYYITQTGPGSGIYKSKDGGEHWTKLSSHGLPKGNYGRIGLGVAPGSGGKIVYTTIIAPKGKSGLYKSNDGGANWKLVNDNGSLANSYFSRITVDPHNPNTVYVMDRSIHKSVDGGKTFKYFKGAPGGDDYHFLWINPKYPDHMITGSDQGCVVTVNNGESWSSWYNQPTGQFYHVEVDDQFPYKIYSGQQDNGTVGILSRGPYGVIELRDWHPVGGDERDYDIPKPGNPDLVFGSGLGGPISRFNEITRQVAQVSPWPVSTYGAKPNTVKYRYTWITPLVFSHIKPYPLYFANQYLFKSTDNGDHWTKISPDLSGKKDNASNCDDPDLAKARSCGFGVIFCISPSPVDQNVIWIGTDDGIIQMTKDGGKHWNNVSPKEIPGWGRVDAISQSVFSKNAVYAAVNTHRMGDFAPLIYKTTNDGKTWEKIINGLPGNEYVNSVRADRVKQGLLFASTNRSVYVSFNDGSDWQPLTLNLPTTPVRDIIIHGNDLIAGTQGRGIWILDDIEPLRELNPSTAQIAVHLFSPAQAWRLRADENHDTPWPPSTPLGKNPPAGAIIDYMLGSNSQSPVKLTITDSRGKVIRSFASDAEAEKLKTNRYFEEAWLGKSQKLSAEAGMHRFIWDLRYPRPKALHYGYSIAAVWDDDTPINPEGPLVLPGKYKVTLTVNGKKYTQPLIVKEDPRVHISNEALKEQLKLALTINNELAKSVSLHSKLENILKEGNISGAVKDSLSNIADKGHPGLSSVIGGMAGLISDVQAADAAPTQGQKELFSHYKKQLDGLISRFNRIEKK